MLMTLFLEALQREVDELDRNNVRLNFIGARRSLQAELQDMMVAAEKQTANNSGLQLRVAIAYGGRWDIVDAVRRITKRAVIGEIDVDEIDEDTFGQELALGGVPDPDLLIRTGGERRISNFLLWNLAYAELWFSDVLWPDFSKADFDEAIAYFARRERRYGHTGDQVKAVNS